MRSIFVALALAVVGSCAPLKLPHDTGPVSDGVAYPIRVDGVVVTLLSTNDPEIDITFTNTGTDVVNETVFDCAFFQNGNPVLQFGSGAPNDGLADEDDVQPGEQRTSTWDQFGWDGTIEVVITDRDVLLTNGKKLTCGAGDVCADVAACLATETTCPHP